VLAVAAHPLVGFIAIVAYEVWPIVECATRLLLWSHDSTTLCTARYALDVLTSKHVLMQYAADGHYDLVPGRPDLIGANGAAQYSIITSTGLAAAYTSFASNYHQRIIPSLPISTTALFIRSSARLGV
jgi:hypothetical protein